MGVTESKDTPVPGYDPTGFFCEIISAAERGVIPKAVVDRLRSIETKELSERAEAASRELYNLGITFTVYSDRTMIDRILPFDVLPRVIGASEWETIERGVAQRVTALNLFIRDIYHDQKCLKDGIIPADLVLGNKNYRKQMEGLDVPGGTYVHVCGIDLVRDGDGNFCVLEDNARTPSGVSYVVENRHMMQRAFPDLMDDIGIRPVDDYGPKLLQAMLDVAPAGPMDPQVALLSPGAYNSAYFEHIFLAREMGVPLVEGRDLLVENDRVYMRTTEGVEEVHCIYRRIDDDFLDPEAFRKDSLLGVPGIFDAYRKGNITLANAIGTGVADDKAVYAYMPRLIQYYLGEDAILANVPTNICREAEGLSYTLDNLEDLVVKPVGESGGYGILIGPRATKDELAEFRAKIKEDPANFISQPMINLSVCPTLVDGAVEPRHVDLRPFCVTGKSSWVLPGGLTRVALRKGSLVVNSSQGGGSKDTWVLTE
ncbi:MAG: circularly permuted type 2 ATP-grasp protein [Alphaproteobacteria bacterium]|uniref:circularly permuted type 2 ATP-grasp protein n=1 Tax=Pacificispira sp. TaxID=2888761 RepID=UPI001B0853C7|nr:circularly permuted type 2 ATP-grasp protein [Alphaproteobacteria bacterium]MBO6862223.1 circularly permuted type 2 ATP-grasp protein [Alphaproteobacteria bacterium]MEC9267675.1 circularly permuted type 2 ATP-grasp protein [Pseudomonadota bacterium]